MRQARKAAGLSQVELAQRLLMGASTLSGYETGRFELTVDVLRGYERETGRPLEWLLRGDQAMLARAEVMAAAARITEPRTGSLPGIPLGGTEAFAAFAGDAVLLQAHGVTPAELEALRTARVPYGPPGKEELLLILLAFRRWRIQE